jgi:FAT domain
MFLERTISSILSAKQRRQLMDRFFSLVSGDSNEEIKIVSMQLLTFPLIWSIRTASQQVLASPTAASLSSSGASLQAALLDSTTITSFVKTVFLPNIISKKCSDRFKIEIFRLILPMMDCAKDEFSAFCKDIVRACWSYLKSEDSVCKLWSQLLLSKLISAFETPDNITLQIFSSLLRTHQVEGRDIVKASLDILSPALEERLSKEGMARAIDQMIQLTFEDGTSSVPQLTHLYALLVRCASVFHPYRHRFVSGVTSSLSRIVLPSSSPAENRLLAADLIALLLRWNEEEEERGKKEDSQTKLLTLDQVDLTANFIVRLMVSVTDTDPRVVKSDGSYVDLDRRLVASLSTIVDKWNVTIKPHPFEKAINKDKAGTSSILPCLSVIAALAKSGNDAFCETNVALVDDIIALAFANINDDVRVQYAIRNLCLSCHTRPSMRSKMLICLEKVIIESLDEQRRGSPNKIAEATRPSSTRSKDRSPGPDDGSVPMSTCLFCIDNAKTLCKVHQDSCSKLTSSLLGLLAAYSKAHIQDATAKQRQGTWQSPRQNAPGIMSPTPTTGILKEMIEAQNYDSFKGVSSRSTPVKESNQMNMYVRAMIFAIEILDESGIVQTFTTMRKQFIQIVTSILESSDNIQLLLVCARMVGRWLLANDQHGPLTTKERSSFLWRLSSFDHNGLQDDATAQPLADLVAHLMLQLYSKNGSTLNKDDILMSKSLVANLLVAQPSLRASLISTYIQCRGEKSTGIDMSVYVMLWRVLKSDLEGLGGRYWIALCVDLLLLALEAQHTVCIKSMRMLIHGDTVTCQRLFDLLLPLLWRHLPNDKYRVKLSSLLEKVLVRPFHAQFFRHDGGPSQYLRSTNVIRSLLHTLSTLRPLPFISPLVVVSLAENYNAWFEALNMLQLQYPVLEHHELGAEILSAMRHCYRQLNEGVLFATIATKSCNMQQSRNALLLDIYGKVNQAVGAYEGLVDLVQSSDGLSPEPSDFEMDLWEERWVDLNRELCQNDVVSDYASSSGSTKLKLHCAWRAQQWKAVRSLCTSTELLSSVESGDPCIKLCETLLAVSDGKLTDVENLHAQTAQLCLHRWQLMPKLFSGSHEHASLLHFFHRLVEVRESGQIMVEINNHSSLRTLPDLKNLLNAWRHRLPNDFDTMRGWDEVFAWRAQMFNAITSNFQWSEPNTLATLHDRPWTTLRLAKTSRKHKLRDVSLLLLNRTTEERAMNVADAYMKLREQILVYFNMLSELERHGGLNLVNTTNLSYFDSSQKSELFRLKAMFLDSLGNKPKANQAYCHSVQICPSYARAWESWGALCTSLGQAAEKQTDDAPGTPKPDESSKDNNNNNNNSSSVSGVSNSTPASKKVLQYLAQAMGCFFEAIEIEPTEWRRLYLPKCLWMLTKEATAPGLLSSTFEKRASNLPAWVWLPWISQLLTGLCRLEGRAIKSVFTRIVKAYPQAVYYPLRAFYLERRDVERSRGTTSSAHHMPSVSYAEEMMSMLRRSHTSLWSSLESILEELLVKFRPSTEEEFLATIYALLERAEVQTEGVRKSKEKEIVVSIWKTLCRISTKYFRPTEATVSSGKKDERATKNSEFRDTYRDDFERDFEVSSAENSNADLSFGLEELLARIRMWRKKVEDRVLSTPPCISLLSSSRSLAMYCVGNAPDLWVG